MADNRLGVGFIGGGFVAQFHIRSWVGVRDADVRGVVTRPVEDADEAVGVLRSRLHPQDVVLVKGSRGVQMDNIVPELEAVR